MHFYIHELTEVFYVSGEKMGNFFPFVRRLTSLSKSHYRIFLAKAKQVTILSPPYCNALTYVLTLFKKGIVSA